MTKPPYYLPTMEDIAQIPWNELNAISTFSGCGGSSLGYKMAGFKVLWASEFIPAAQETYRANHPATILDTRDIRQVKPSDILDAIGMRPGDLDVFDGSPPCASFSTAGSREDGWGKVKKYSDSEQRTDDLFFEFVRLVHGVQPKAFVAENVSGLVKGTAKGYFLDILARLKDAGYNVRCKVLDAQWLGVPQSRQRTIFIGFRNDLGIEPAFPKPLPYQYTLREAIPWIRATGGIRATGFNGGIMQTSDRPCPTIMAHGGNGMNTYQFGVDAETDISKYAIGREWDRMGKPGTQSDKYFSLVRPDLDKPCPTITQTAGNVGAAGVCHPTERRKFTIPELKRICGFPPDFALTGTFMQQWERLGRAVPPPMMMHIAASVRDQLKKAT